MSIKKEKPELVILDVIMPEMNGFQVCSFYKKRARSKKHLCLDD